MRKEKLEELNLKMQSLGISESDLVEKFILGSGSGGQKINKTSSCVYLKRQRERSREMNRFYARRELCERLEELRDGKESARQQEIEKIRRQKRRRTRKSQEKMLADKKKTSEKKALRKNPKE